MSAEDKLEQMNAMEYADVYDAEHNTPFFHALYDITLKEWIKKDLITGLVLDYGCGTGIGLQFYKHLPVLGIDISFSMLKKIQMKMPNIELLQCDGEHLPFKDCVFDSSLSMGVLHHLSEPAIGLTEINRVLKKGGNLCLFDVQESHIGNFAEFVSALFFKKKTKHIRKYKIDEKHPGHPGKNFMNEVLEKCGNFQYKSIYHKCINHQWLPFQRFWKSSYLIWKFSMRVSELFDNIPSVKHKGGVVVAILRKI